MATTRDYEPNVVLSNQDYNVVGTRPLRPDGADKVTGRALYGADFAAAGLLSGSVLRSPHAHARIKSIDTSKAEALDGVRAVVTSADFPQGGEGPVQWQRDNVLASDKALYRGHAIAAVAAASPHIAEEAVSLIDVDYEVLTPVTDVQSSMKGDAPILHDSLMTDELGEKADKASNVASHFQHVKGDVEAGFKEADVVIEREFTTKTVHQGYIEPQAATALWNNDGRLHIWCSTQGSFAARDACARILDIPVSQIRVVPLEIGGGFGGKIDVYLEPVAALLSKKTGTPVKLVMSRADVLQGTGPTPGSYAKIKIGAKKDGTITAAHAYLAMEAGAYPGSPVGAGAMCVLAPYDLENALVDGYDVVVNKPKTAAYRAPGAPNAAFAGEQVIDEVAKAIGMDPIDFRMKNAAKEGTRQVHGPTFPRVGYEEVLEAMKSHPHYNAPLDGPNQGRGVAVGFWFNIGFDSACNIAVNADGTVTLQEGSTDIGGTRASIAMQAAEVLTLPYEKVHPTVVDTDTIGFTAVTGGSRTTFATGWAAYEAAQDVRTKMIDRAAQIWEVDADTIELEDAVFKSKSDPELSMTFAELAGQLGRSGGGITGTAAVSPAGVGGAFAGNIVDVEVDPETGKTEILRFTVVQDAGKAIHPSYVEGQMQGGAVQGIGWALNEEYYMSDSGTMDNVSLLDYRMPTSLDLPMIDTVIVEVANPGHPYGVRGVGEAPIIPPTPAIANAIENAIGTRLFALPMNPAAVTKAVMDQ
ncbi:MAG: oxidoreductase [Dehalococcoidia bacterium]|nr:MAG: oxidoreductase [Dehalococcoidia bacterium]